MSYIYQRGITIVDTSTNLPNPASCLGIGVILDILCLAISNGVSWRILNDYGFSPTILSTQVTSTTTVTGQSEEAGSGVTKLHVVNISTVESSYIGLGTTIENAETACSTGTPGLTKFILPPNTEAFINMYANTCFAWVNLSGTSTLQITQGV